MTDLSTIEARRQLAGKYASKYGLEVALVCAVVEQESTWNPWACRFEPMFYDRYIQPLLNTNKIHTATEANTRSTSYGLMQVMGQVAMEYGFTGRFLTELCDPDVGLEYGCRKLKRACDQHPGDVRGALLSYNGGSDPQYPDLVLRYLQKYQ